MFNTSGEEPRHGADYIFIAFLVISIVYFLWLLVVTPPIGTSFWKLPVVYVFFGVIALVFAMLAKVYKKKKGVDVFGFIGLGKDKWGSVAVGLAIGLLFISGVVFEPMSVLLPTLPVYAGSGGGTSIPTAGLGGVPFTAGGGSLPASSGMAPTSDAGSTGSGVSGVSAFTNQGQAVEILQPSAYYTPYQMFITGTQSYYFSTTPTSEIAVTGGFIPFFEEAFFSAGLYPTLAGIGAAFLGDTFGIFGLLATSVTFGLFHLLAYGGAGYAMLAAGLFKIITLIGIAWKRSILVGLLAHVLINVTIGFVRVGMGWMVWPMIGLSVVGIVICLSQRGASLNASRGM